MREKTESKQRKTLPDWTSIPSDEHQASKRWGVERSTVSPDCVTARSLRRDAACLGWAAEKVGAAHRPGLGCPPGIPSTGNPSSKVIQLIELQQSAKATGQALWLVQPRAELLGLCLVKLLKRPTATLQEANDSRVKYSRVFCNSTDQLATILFKKVRKLVHKRQAVGKESLMLYWLIIGGLRGGMAIESLRR